MILSHSHKFIFIHIQRTGGSSILTLLKRQLGQDLDIVSQHGNVRSAEGQILRNHQDYFTFTFVRNPWERILSWYLLININNQDSIENERLKFEHYLEQDLAYKLGDNHFHYNQLDYISDQNGNLLTDKIYRFDNYENAVRQLFQKLNLSVIEIPSLNGSKKIKYRDYYTLRSKHIIAQKCKKDIDHFGYKF